MSGPLRAARLGYCRPFRARPGHLRHRLPAVAQRLNVQGMGQKLQRVALYGAPKRSTCSASVSRGAPLAIQAYRAGCDRWNAARAATASGRAFGGTGNTRDELRCSSHATTFFLPVRPFALTVAPSRSGGSEERRRSRGAAPATTKGETAASLRARAPLASSTPVAHASLCVARRHDTKASAPRQGRRGGLRLHPRLRVPLPVLLRRLRAGSWQPRRRCR
jgi:hypothetical protein